MGQTIIIKYIHLLTTLTSIYYQPNIDSLRLCPGSYIEILISPSNLDEYVHSSSKWFLLDLSESVTFFRSWEGDQSGVLRFKPSSVSVLDLTDFLV